MLVVSRRAKEKLSFPDIGVTIHFIRVQSGSVKVGVDAPMHIQIVRDEVDNDVAAAADATRKEFLRLPKEIRHAIRNELHAISVGLHLYREQMQLGLKSDAEETFGVIQESLKTLDENEVLCRQGIKSESSCVPADGTILVVEDDENEREMLAGLLRIKGYDVAAVVDGKEAMTYLTRHDTPRVILLDMKMPNQDGATTVQQIRASSKHRGTTMYALSATSPEDNGVNMGRSGIDRWFEKPLAPEQLIDALADEFDATMDSRVLAAAK